MAWDRNRREERRALWRAGSLEFEFTAEETSPRRPRRITVEASIDGEPSTLRTTHGYPGRPTTLTNLRAGATYTVRFSGSGLKTVTREFEAVEGDVEKVPVSMETKSTRSVLNQR